MTPDVTRNRHRGNPQSIAANERSAIVRQSQERKILELLQARNMTARECMEAMRADGWRVDGLNCISGRFTSLCGFEQIAKTGIARDHCAEYRFLRWTREQAADPVTGQYLLLGGVR